MKYMEREEIFCCPKTSRAYPDRLRCFDDMPEYLYVKGKLPDSRKKSVAIVGARRCSNYGSSQAYYFAKELSLFGIQIISGMARGVDGWAHRGALDGGGETFAVLGSGPDICYPRQNIDIYRRIPLQGGILSEYEPQTPALPRHFPRRNRIISALADLVLVIEAGKKSGSLITVNFALEQGRTVYALPGRLGDALSEGCNNLIFEGAGIANSVDIILDELQISDKLKADLEAKSNFRLASREEMVYSCLDLRPKYLEEIFLQVELNPGEIQEILLKLELKGLVAEPVKNYYARTGG